MERFTGAPLPDRFKPDAVRQDTAAAKVEVCYWRRRDLRNVISSFVRACPSALRNEGLSQDPLRSCRDALDTGRISVDELDCGK